MRKSERGLQNRALPGGHVAIPRSTFIGVKCGSETPSVTEKRAKWHSGNSALPGTPFIPWKATLVLKKIKKVYNSAIKYLMRLKNGGGWNGKQPNRLKK